MLQIIFKRKKEKKILPQNILMVVYIVTKDFYFK